jgi:hypothetical protein
VLADGGGYSGETFAQAVQEKLGCGVEIAKRSELPTFAVIPKRWVVERSFAWLENRRLWKTVNANSTIPYIWSYYLLLLHYYSKIVNGFLKTPDGSPRVQTLRNFEQQRRSPSIHY